MGNFQKYNFRVRKLFRSFKTNQKEKKVRPSWFNNTIKRLICDKKRAFCRYKNNPIQEHEVAYKLVRSQLKKSIRNAKRQSEINLALECKGDVKKFFCFYKFKGKRETVGLFDINESVVHDDEGKVKALNAQFVSVFTREKDITDIQQNEMPTACVSDIDISIVEINKLLRGLKENTACGPDEIYAKMLRELADELALPLQILFHRSFNFSEIPEDWKCANVVPIYKGGGKTKPSNYRPISLTSLVCKLFEKMLKSVIQIHLESNDVLQSSQHGFRPGRSCLTNLLSFLDFTLGESDKGKKVSVIYLDFSKAFDKVPHGRLILALKQHGLDGLLLKWIQIWLTGRKQRVILNGTKSDWTSVESGVPQGSVLAPLLFIIFVNNIDSGLVSKIWKFADDVKVAAVVETEQDIATLQNDLDRIADWTSTWQMRLNMDKCKLLNIGKRNTSSFHLNSSELVEVREEKDLGVLVTQDLHSSKQCTLARNKSLRMLGLLNRNVHYKSKHVMKQLYCSYVRPHLEYCIQAWHPVYKKDLQVLERVQRKATKMINGLKSLTYEKRLERLNLPLLYHRRLRGDMIELFKIVKGTGAPELKALFEINNNSRTRGHRLKLNKKHTKLLQYKSFFTNRVVNEWNVLPASVIESSTLCKFKKELDKHYLSQDKMFKIA